MGKDSLVGLRRLTLKYFFWSANERFYNFFQKRTFAFIRVHLRKISFLSLQKQEKGYTALFLYKQIV